MEHGCPGDPAVVQVARQWSLRNNEKFGEGFGLLEGFAAARRVRRGARATGSTLTILQSLIAIVARGLADEMP